MEKIDKYTYGKTLLEKYGWKSGKGLGRSESGISEALKPTLKFDKAGIGHNPGDDFSFHWWDHVFNKAASNIVVEHFEGGVKMSKKDEDQVVISTNKWKHKKKRKTKNSTVEKEPLKYGRFVKTSVLIPSGEQRDKDDDTSDDADDMIHRTEQDDVLFEACEGRTAHKGARHGLTASGKLKRLEAQEHGATSSSQSLLSKTTQKRELNLNGNTENEISNICKTTRKKRKNRDGEIKNSGPNSEEQQDISNVNYSENTESKQEGEIRELLFSESNEILNQNGHENKKRRKRKKHKKQHVF